MEKGASHYQQPQHLHPHRKRHQDGFEFTALNDQLVEVNGTVRDFVLTDTENEFSFNPASTALALTDASENVWLWNIAGWQSLNFTTPTPELASTGTRNDTMTAYAPDGSLLAATDGFDVILLDAAIGAEVRRLDGCTGVMMSFAFSSNSALLTVAASEGLCLFNVATGELAATFTSGDWLNTVVFSSDQMLIVTAGKDHTARVYGLP